MHYRHKYVDLKQLADWGLIAEINTKILNPLGLMLTYDPATGTSDTVLVADGFRWEYDKAIVEDNKKRLKVFKSNRTKILNSIPYK